MEPECSLPCSQKLVIILTVEILLTLKMETACSSITLIHNQKTAQRNNPEYRYKNI
jgi:hypothetical protein